MAESNRSETGSQSAGFLGQVRDRTTAQLNTQKDRATEGLGSVAQAVRQSTQQLREKQHETVAQYVDQAAEQIDRFAQRLRQKDIGEIVNDAQRLARKQPALFIGSAFALGLIGARFLKSSSQERPDDWRQIGGDSRRTGGEYGRTLPIRGTGPAGGVVRDYSPAEGL